MLGKVALAVCSPRYALDALLLMTCVASSSASLAQLPRAGETGTPLRAEPPGDQALTRLVNPLIGTAASSASRPVLHGDGGSTFPGASAPFGMLQWSPDTPHGQPSGYNDADDTIEAFSLTHFNGAGCPNNEDFPIMPVLGPLVASPALDWTPYSARFDHALQRATPGYYAVTLAPQQIKVELTATGRVALGRFSFPPSHDATILIDASHHAQELAPGAIAIDGPNSVSGWGLNGDFCGQGQRFKIYFAASFDRPAVRLGTWDGPALRPAQASAEGARVGGYLVFDTSQAASVLMKVAISYVSVANAKQNLEAAGPAFDFDALQQRTDRDWNALLNRIQVRGGTPEQTTQFYSALYHVLLAPNLYSDANGEYLAFDGQRVSARDFVDYQNFSGWDIYRSWVQLMAMIAPSETRDMVRSLLDDGQRGGALPRWGHEGRETGVMVGDPGALIVANAHAFGVRDFDTKAALALMDKAGTHADTRSQDFAIRPGLADYIARQYVPEQPAVTLEYASADFAIARFAHALGDDKKSRAYLTRAGYWRNVFNPESGFVQSRGSDGAWSAAFDPGSGQYFVEGNAAQYTFMVPHDLAGLFEQMGGASTAIARLDLLFEQLNAGWTQPYFYIGNEPQFATPWAYNFAGAAHKTQETVRRILGETFHAGASGLPGNDDLGATSSWYVWAALGMYPAIVGTDILVMHGPLFPEIDVRLARGRVLRIRARGAGADAPYVQSVRVNGGATQRSWLRFAELSAGGKLEFVMGTAPNPRWGAAPADRPPSFAARAPSKAQAAPPLGRNLALGHQVTGSEPCTPFEGAGNVVDGKLAGDSKWCSRAPERFVQVDLGAKRPIAAIVIAHAGLGAESTDRNTRDYEIDVSDDASHWTRVVAVADNHKSRTVHTLTRVQARHVRIRIATPTSAPDEGARIYELEVHGPR
jgi:predicted alpha-1,2-mannosidase